MLTDNCEVCGDNQSILRRVGDLYVCPVCEIVLVEDEYSVSEEERLQWK